MDADVIVIGAGSMGMAAGYYLSLSGKKTLLLDAHKPPHDKGSHHGETRIIRYAYGEGKEYVPLVLRAKELWKDLEERTKKKLFIETGVINVGHKDCAFIKNTKLSAEKYNLPLEVLSPEAVNKKWPGLFIPEHFVGCYESTSGVLKCEDSIRAYHDLAVANGVSILTDRGVDDIVVKDDHVLVRSKDYTYKATSLIITAGAGTNKLLTKLGLCLPLEPVRKTFAWYEADESIFNQAIFPAFSFTTKNGTFYGFPSIEGAGLKIGRHDGGLPIDPQDTLDPFGSQAEDEGDLNGVLEKYMPKVDRLLYGKTCIYTNTPDEKFIVDQHPDHKHIYIAAGFSGHGFKFSSAIGQALSQWIVKGETEIDLSAFMIDRFID